MGHTRQASGNTDVELAELREVPVAMIAKGSASGIGVWRVEEHHSQESHRGGIDS